MGSIGIIIMKSFFTLFHTVAHVGVDSIIKLLKKINNSMDTYFNKVSVVLTSNCGFVKTYINYELINYEKIRQTR